MALLDRGPVLAVVFMATSTASLANLEIDVVLSTPYAMYRPGVGR